MTLRRFCALLALLLFAAASPAGAQTFPPFTGLVVDAANVLPADVKASLTAKLEVLQKDTKRQLVVATIPDLQGYPIEQYGYKLGRAWGVGLKNANNGIILFIAPNEPKGHRGPRIEVGTGLEPIVTDALSSQIINQQMMPLLQQQKVPDAMVAGADALIAQLRAAPEEAKAKVDAATADFDRQHRRSNRGSGEGIPFGVLIWVMIIGFVVLSGLRGRMRGRRYYGDGGGGGSSWPIILWGLSNALDSHERGSSWGGGSWSGSGGGGSDSDGSWGGGGFTGGGGGSFGGGGASGGW
ncbi:MAG: TPM domain-containing protein [Sphingomonas sp.]|uniref:TPM domain-containing protein n=1 Tax=Sphingomonas sp. TaxID=28214 RepID=UPI001AC74B6A|nr:TPM domain-containing protein [Sphingomonas sp.]MBN8808830.1 TPM domain-containing protein [Sphingomonas sp.]